MLDLLLLLIYFVAGLLTAVIYALRIACSNEDALLGGFISFIGWPVLWIMGALAQLWRWRMSLLTK